MVGYHKNFCIKSTDFQKISIASSLNERFSQSSNLFASKSLESKIAADADLEHAEKIISRSHGYADFNLRYRMAASSRLINHPSKIMYLLDRISDVTASSYSAVVKKRGLSNFF